MQDKLNVVEIDRRTTIARSESDRIREESNLFDRRLRESLESRRRAWEQGFVAGLEAQALARGTRDFPDDEPTAPYPIIDPDLIVVE